MADYFNPSPLQVYTGTTAQAAQINSISSAVDAAFDLVTADIIALEAFDLTTLTDGSNADLLHIHNQYALDTDLTTHAALSDVHHAESHTIASHSDTTATGAELETLTNGSNADLLHLHATVAHTVASHSDTTATGAELEALTNGSNADLLHVHATAGIDTYKVKMEVGDTEEYLSAKCGVGITANATDFSVNYSTGLATTGDDILIDTTWLDARILTFVSPDANLKRSFLL